MSKILVIEPHYMPCIEYFVLLKNYDEVIIDVHEPYVKQTFRNRTNILGANNVIALSIPVIHRKNKDLHKDMRISYEENWNRRHWKSIQSSYGKSAFFEYYADYFFPVLTRREEFLIDVTIEMLTICLKIMQIDMKVSFSEESIDSKDTNFDIRKTYIRPSVDYRQRKNFHPKPYIQVFGSEFVPNLSIIDMLFCLGPESSYNLDETHKEYDDSGL